MTRASYDMVARRYETHVVPYYTPIALALVKLLRPRRGMRVLDVGAGTGLASRLIEPRLGPKGLLVLVDISTQMLEVARTALPAGARAAPTLLMVAEMQEIPLVDAQFDLAVAQFSTLEELPAAMREVHRLLKPGGRLAMATWGPDRLHDEYRVLKAVREQIGAAPQPKNPAVSEVVARLRRAGFDRVQSSQQFFPGIYRSAADYIRYRDGFPWKTVYPRRFWSSYLAAIAHQAELRRDRTAGIVIRRSVTFISATKPARRSTRLP